METTTRTATKKPRSRFRALMRASGRDISATRPTLGLMRAATIVNNTLEAAVAPSGLSAPKFNVLMELAAAPEGRLPLCQLAGRLVRSAPNVSALIDRMEQQQLVRRVRDENDRRVVFAQITEEGWRSIEEPARAVFASEQELFEELSDVERRELVRLLLLIGAARG